MKTKSILFMVFLLTLLLSCGENSGTNSNDQLETLSAESRFAAMWLRNTLVPPEDLALRIQNDLNQIRSKFADSLEIFNQNFTFPVMPHLLSIGLTDDAVAKIRQGKFNNWDELNARFGTYIIDTSLLNAIRGVRLHFEISWNTVKVASYYHQIEGIRYSNPVGQVGDFPNFYPWFVQGELVYLFRDAWGDCPSGCLHSHFWYVKRINGEWTIIGDFKREYQMQYPDWWDEISEAYLNFWHQLSAE